MLLALVAGCSREPQLEPGVRRVVLITLDTLRASSTTPYGADAALTPNLARFARESVQYDRAYTTMPTTGPAHISILTGLYPQQHGSLKNGVPARENLASLPRRLGDAGWRTAAFVSSPFLGPRTLGLGGFEVWDTPGGVRDGALTVDRALDWLDAHADDSFFLWIHLFDPHAPYESHDDLPAALASALAPLEGVPTRDHYSFLRRAIPPEEARKLALLYQADVFHTDRQVGRVLARLEEAGLDEDALTVITADHGEILGEVLESIGYGFDHGETLLPGEIQVPLWVRGPGFGSGARVGAVVEMRALFGSILWATGLEIEGDAPRLPGFGRGAGEGSGAAFVTRRVFSGPRVPSPLRGSGYAMVTADTLVIRGHEGLRALDLSADPLGRVDRAAGVDELDGVLSAWWEGHAAGLETQPQAIDESLQEQLRALGYLH